MIRIFTGGNTFEIQSAVRELEAHLALSAERIDGATVQLSNIPDLFMGLSLFADRRLVVIDQLSVSSGVWAQLPDWIARVSDAIEVVLIEPSLDKRTVVYKALKQAADIQDFPVWTEKDAVKAEAWVTQRAQESGVSLARPVARYLVGKVGVDQWALHQAIEVLSLADAPTSITEALIDEIIVPSLEENAFELIEAALSSRPAAIGGMIQKIALTEEPQRLMALILSQVFSLTAVVLASADAEPAKDFGIHPFVVSKLRHFRSSLGQVGAFSILQLCAQADADMKLSKAEPWVLVEQLLLKIAYRDFS